MQNEPQAIEENAENELIVGWLSIAESQLCALEVMAEQVAKLDGLIEGNIMTVSDNFTTVMDLLRTGQGELSAGNVAEMDLGQAQAALGRAEQLFSDSMGAVMNAVVGLQFQDRASQNLVIVQDLINVFTTYLRRSISESQLCIGNAEGRPVLDPHLAQMIHTSFKLGELQHQFITHLIQHGYIAKPEDIGISEKVVHDSQNSVELF